MLFSSLRLGLLITIFFTLSLSAQERESAVYQSAYLSIQLDDNGKAELTLNLTCQHNFSDLELQIINRTFGITLKSEGYESEATPEQQPNPQNKGLIFYFGRGEMQFQRSGQQINDVLDLKPALAILKNSGIRELFVNLNYPAEGFADFTPSNEENALPIENPGLLRYRIDLHSVSLHEIKIVYGYTSQQLQKRFILLGALLLIPILITTIIALTLVQKQRRNQNKGFVHPYGFISLMSHILPVSWWVAVYYTKAGDLISPWTKSDSPWISHPSRIGLYALPPIVIGLICNSIWQFAMGKIKAEKRNFAEIIQQAGLSVIVSLLPTILLYTGIFSLIRGEIRQVVFFFIAYSVFNRFAGKWQWKALGLNPYALPNGILRLRVFALANKAGIKLQQVFLVADKVGKTANAFATAGNNILFTEFLLNHLSQSEIDFIAAHEISHLKANHTSKRALAGFIIIPIVFLLAPLFGFLIGIIGVYSPKLLIFLTTNLYPLILIQSIFLSLLIEMYCSRRFEYTADEDAVCLTGNPEAAISSLVKLGKLNLEPMNGGKISGKLLTHPSIANRVGKIAHKFHVAQDRVEQLISGESLSAPIDSYADESAISTALEISVPNLNAKKIDLPRAKQQPLILTPILSTIFGLAMGWLITTPGYYPHQILSQYNIPPIGVMLAFGLFFGLKKCYSIKKRISTWMPNEIRFLPTNTWESPAITHASEMDEILKYTNYLESIGFLFLRDFTVRTQPITSPIRFARLFFHPLLHCYAEVNHLGKISAQLMPICCTFTTYYQNGWSYTTTNREPDSFTYALRTEKSLWQARPWGSPTDLLEFHLENRAQTSQKYSLQIESELSAEKYFEKNSDLCQSRKENFSRKSIIKFLLEVDSFNRQKRIDWVGSKPRQDRQLKTAEKNKISQEASA